MAQREELANDLYKDLKSFMTKHWDMYSRLTMNRWWNFYKDNQHAPRFYVSLSHAYKYIIYFKKAPSERLLPGRDMKYDLWKVYQELKANNDALPEKQRLKDKEIVYNAIYHPAPSFYASLRIAQPLIKRIIEELTKE